MQRQISPFFYLPASDMPPVGKTFLQRPQPKHLKGSTTATATPCLRTLPTAPNWHCSSQLPQPSHSPSSTTAAYSALAIVSTPMPDRVLMAMQSWAVQLQIEPINGVMRFHMVWMAPPPSIFSIWLTASSFLRDSSPSPGALPKYSILRSLYQASGPKLMP